MTSNSSIAHRDALMRHAAQWEHLASPGHVLLARVKAYRHKVTAAYFVLGGAGLVLLLSFWLPQRVGAVVAWPVGKLAGLFDSKPEVLQTSPAPAVTPFVPRLATTFNDPAVLPAPQVIAGALATAAANLKSGKGIEGCNTSSKVTDAWSTADAAVPHCRYSADKSRLWVWGADGVGGTYMPFLALVRKDDSGVFKIANVAGFQSVGLYPVLQPTLVPRAIAEDFPELKQ